MKKYLIIICAILLPILVKAPPTTYSYSSSELEIYWLKGSELSIANLKRYLTLTEIKHVDKVLAQFILETGWGKSYICRNYNNLFGFLNSKGYMKYNHWTESVESYKRFQTRKYRGGDYYQFLVNVGYAADTTYIDKLKQINSKYGRISN